jgi:hypothetical protein
MQFLYDIMVVVVMNVIIIKKYEIWGINGLW